MENRQIVLRRYPIGIPQDSDFACHAGKIRALEDGEVLIRNLILPMDAGFRQWMRKGSSDNYLKEMALDAPVMSITIGRVAASRHPAHAIGSLVIGRNAWEEYSVADGSDYLAQLDAAPGVPLHYYAGTLGPTGFTAYFGLRDIGQIKAGDTVLISAAAGAVGSVAGQIAKLKGCRTIGITSSPEKCRWLTETVGYDAAINYNDPAGLDAGIKRLCPDGIDVYFDNVGAETLDCAMGNMALNARVVLCGAVAAYNRDGPVPGPYNMWEAITKRATLRGFMFSDYVARYPEALADLSGWIASGKLKSFDHLVDGIEHTPSAFCDMFSGKNYGKAMVRLDTFGTEGTAA